MLVGWGSSYFSYRMGRALGMIGGDQEGATWRKSSDDNRVNWIPPSWTLTELWTPQLLEIFRPRAFSVPWKDSGGSNHHVRTILSQIIFINQTMAGCNQFFRYYNIISLLANLWKIQGYVWSTFFNITNSFHRKFQNVKC